MPNLCKALGSPALQKTSQQKPDRQLHSPTGKPAGEAQGFVFLTYRQVLAAAAASPQTALGELFVQVTPRTLKSLHTTLIQPRKPLDLTVKKSLMK